MKTHPIKPLLLFFSLFVVIYSCEKNDSIIKQEKGLKTVAFEDAQNFIKQIEQGKNKISGENFITSFSEDISYEDLTNTEEELAVIHVTTIYENLYSRIALLEISGEVQSVVVVLNPFENSTESNYYGEILITDMKGDFLKGFEIENNVFIKEYIKNSSKSKSYAKNYGSTSKSTFDCSTCPFSDCNLCDLGTVDLGVIEKDASPTPYVSISYVFPTDGSEGSDGQMNDWNYFGGGGGGYYDYIPEPEADKPCPGDPVPNPRIAAQDVSGLEGGRFGCTRTGGVCENSQEGKDHRGTDVLNAYGEPVYAMYDGYVTAVVRYYAKGAGWISYQTANVNGRQISIQYFHLQENGRVTGQVRAGDIIGYQGDSGNLAGAIASGTVESHVHIKIKDENGNPIDAEDFMASDLTSNTNNCN